MKKILACDPGVGSTPGGFAWNNEEGEVFIQKMPIIYDKNVKRIKNGKTSIDKKTNKIIEHTSKTFKEVRNEIETQLAIRDFLYNFAGKGYELWSERVGKPINKGGYKTNNINAVATFANHVGVLTGISMALFIDLKWVVPTKWQEKLGEFTHGIDDFAYSSRKNEIKALTQRLYPNLKGITLATSDALGIFHVVKEIYKGDL